MTNQEQVVQEVSGRLKRIIEYLQLTQGEFAESMGYGPGYINHMANGMKPLSGGFIYDFTRVYGSTFNVHWLMTGQGSMLIDDNTVVPAVKSNAVELTMAERIMSLERRVSWLEVHAEFKAK